MLEFPAPILVAVRGQCLGGGLEVALAGGPIFAAPTAQFGQPEMKLGVFAPAASVLLPYRVTQPVAEDLLLTGRSINATEAAAKGLVQVLAEDPEAAALAWFEEHLQGKSAASLRLRPHRRARADAARRAQAAGGSGTTLSRAPDAHPRCQRGPRGLPGQTPTGMDPQVGDN